MHNVAEHGAAAHWLYKEMPRGDSSLPWLQIIRQWNDQVESAHDFVRLVRAEKPPPPRPASTAPWLRCTSAPPPRRLRDASATASAQVREELLGTRVFVFTRNGRILNLAQPRATSRNLAQSRAISHTL